MYVKQNVDFHVTLCVEVRPSEGGDELSSKVMEDEVTLSVEAHDDELSPKLKNDELSPKLKKGRGLKIPQPLCSLNI